MGSRWLLLGLLIMIGAGLGLGRLLPGTDSPQSAEKKSLVIKGSDTEVQLVSAFAEAFAATYPDIQISVAGGGSTVGIAALLNQEIDIANSSRPMKGEELSLAEQKLIPTEGFIIARDGLSVIVHPNNPIESLTLEQLGAIYRGEVTDWSQLSAGEGSINLYGRQSTSGTYGFFRDVVLKNDYSPHMRSLEGTQAIVEAVRSDQQGIGYAGVGYVRDENGSVRSDLKVLPISDGSESQPVSPLDEAAVAQGLYPIYRPIYQFLPEIPEPGSSVAQFLSFEVSPVGQEIVKQSGFYPINEEDERANQAYLR